MSQFITNPLERIVFAVVANDGRVHTTLDQIETILRDAGEINSCACGNPKRVDDLACPHHNVYPVDDNG